MRIYTAHVREGREPVLVREGFSWGALFFGPLWLFAHRAWIAGFISACALIAASFLPIPALGLIAGTTIAWVLGLWGQDLRRWSLARRGFALEDVVTGRDSDGALARLLDARPQLVTDLVR